MGETCSRLDCSVVEDCTTTLGKKHYVFWYDCTGQPHSKTSGPGPVASGSEFPEQVFIPQEPEVQLTCDSFAISRSGADANSQWRRRYVLGRELGAGQTAVVFEAYATQTFDEPVSVDLPGTGTAPAVSSEARIQAGGSSSAADRHPNAAARVGTLGRRVALKRLNNTGSKMFQQEVRALLAVGVHPHILRLLECFYEGDEDILVLEYCEGGDVYELYARNNGVGMSEAYVVALIRQLLMALDHLVNKGVEHRDVKPENLLLYGSATNGEVPHLKLADFGWASIVTPTTKPAPVPPEGVGSLWYAPPELNPPVDGIHCNNENVQIGRSDMWSVGIITYLLLVGHSPFNFALRVVDPAAREAEVLRLAALGQMNQTTRSWSRLSQEARQFIAALIKPEANQRLSPKEAWVHKFLVKFNPGHVEDSLPPTLSPPGGSRGVNVTGIWQALDGFQRLSWLAIARAVAEPELLEGTVFKVLINGQQMGCPPYLEQLAAELAAAAVPMWFQPNTVWADVLQLAFRYLDVDIDGMLSCKDLNRHIVSDEAEKFSSAWLARWQRAREASAVLGPEPAAGLSFTNFCMALWSSIARRHVVAESSPAHLLPGGPQYGDDKKKPDLAESIEEATLRIRMSAIEEVCDQFIEAESGDISTFNDHTAW